MSLLRYEDEVFNSDNPFVDLLIYNLKILCFNSIIKDAYEADNQETLSSIKKSDIYIACIEKRAEISTFNYIPEQILRRAGVSTNTISKYNKKYYEKERTSSSTKLASMYKNKPYSELSDSYPVYSIPEEYHEEIVRLMIPWYIENYQEENNYYRMLLGMPPYGDPGVSIKEFEYLIPDYIKEEYDEKAIYFHELGTDVNKSLEELGILEVIRHEYPQYKYLNYLTQGIDLYTARTKLDMQLLSTPDIDSNVLKVFVDRYEKNRDYVLTTVYTKAMEIQSDYYHSFMIVYTLLMTFVDILVDIQHHIVTKDILDRRCIKYIFSMYGVPYFKIIPYKYQERLCKNINNILKYKSSDKGILDIVKLFGFENIEIWKWCLVKNFKLNSWGDFDYKEYRALTCGTNTLINTQILEETEDNSKPLYYDQISKYYPSNEGDYEEFKYIPYPFPYYLEKGNVMLVEADGKMLSEDDYIIYDYNKIHFVNDVEEVKFRFYYDNTTEGFDNFPTNDKNYVKIYHTTDYEEVIDDPQSFDLSNTELSEFFINNNYQIIVILNGVWLKQGDYSIDYENKIVTLEEVEYDMYNDLIDFVFIQSKTFYTVYEKNTSTIEDGKATIDEPFEGYLENENNMFLTIDGEYIDDYEIDDGNIVVNEKYNDKEMEFHYLYSNMSTIPSLELREQHVTITSTEPYQTLFDIEFPISNYNTSGYKVFVKTLGWWLPSSYYNIVGESTLNLTNANIAPQEKGREFELYLVYIPEDRTQQKNITVKTDYIIAEEDYQKSFTIDLPFEDYLELGNSLILDVEGIYLRLDDINDGYTIEVSDTSSITIVIENRDIRPKKGQRLNLTYYYYKKTHDYKLGVKIQRLGIVENDNTTYQLDYPFYPYLKTNHNILLQAGKKIIDEQNIEYTDQFHFRFIGLDSEEYEKYIKDNELVVLYFYNEWYLYNKPQEFTIETKSHTLTNGQVELITPCHQYIENKWPYVVIDEEMNVLEEYDVYDHTLYSTDISKCDLMYIYMVKDGYLYEDISGESSNSELYFFRSVLGEEDAIKNCKDKSKWKSYDSITMLDKWWDGLYYYNMNHESIKNSIYNEKFNYERTKYYQIASIVNLSEFTAQIGYFYGMLYNDILATDNILVSIPILSSNHKFKLSHLFIYMSVLTYVFNGYEDMIIDVPSSNMWIQGFNFDSDLDELKKYIYKNHHHYSDYPIWDFTKPQDVDNIVSFIDTYKTNYKIRQTILKNMSTADSYKEYKIWKKIYDGLLLTKMNMEYFTKSNGDMATTYTEFLEDKDKILYDSIMSIKAMGDQESLEDEIINIINSIIYVLEEYLDGSMFKYTFSMIVSKDSASVLKYISTLIDFFKSYKVSLLTRSDTLEVGNTYELDSYVRPMDDVYLNEIVNNRDYMRANETQSNNESTILTDGARTLRLATIMDDNHIEYHGLIREDVLIQQIEKGMVYKYFEGSLLIESIDYSEVLDILIQLEGSLVYEDLEIYVMNTKKDVEEELFDMSTTIEKQIFSDELFYISLYLREIDLLAQESNGKTIVELYNSLITTIPQQDYGTLVVTIRKIAEEEGSLEAFFKESKIESIPEQVSFVDDEGYFVTDHFEDFSKDNTDLNQVVINGGLAKNNGKDKHFSSMFSGCTQLSSVNKFFIKQPIINAYEDTSAGTIILDSMFKDCVSLYNGLDYVDSVQGISMRESYSGCILMSDPPTIRTLFGNLDLYKTFADCTTLQYLPDIYFGEYDVSLIIGEEPLPLMNLDQTFIGCTHLIQNTGSIGRGFIFTHCEAHLYNTFEDCSRLLEGIPIKINNHSKIKMQDTYKNCTSLKNGGQYVVSHSSSLEMKDVFSGCNHLTYSGSIVLNDFSSVLLDETYAYCTSLQDIDSLLPNNRMANTSLCGTFRYCISLSNVTIDMSSVNSINDIFTGCESLESVTFINPRSNIKPRLNHLTLDNNTLQYEIIILEEES